MSLPVLAGFAGVLVAAVATGMLAGRCVRQPRPDMILWTVATLGLTVALGAQSLGFASGFGPATFRAVQLCALLLAPLALAWGLVELVAQSGAARFGMRLVSSALIAVATVILGTDPLTAQPFSKSWPSTGAHSQPFSHYALDAAQVVAVVAVAVCAGLAVARARNDPQWRPAQLVVALIGLAVLMTVALRFSLPDRSGYPLLSLMAAALAWFGVTRIPDLPGLLARQERASGSRPSGAAGGLRDSQPGPHHDHRPQAGDAVAGGRYVTYGQPSPGDPRRPPAFAAPPGPGRPEPGRPGAGVPDWAADGADQAKRAYTGGAPQAPGRPGRPRGTGTGVPVPDERPAGPHGAGRNPSGTGIAPFPGPEPRPASASARPYGRILIFTLLDDRVADFDRLAEQAAEEVRTAEPGTLVYVIHLVPNAPLQRIFYEIYRDREAFDRHEGQPYMKRFVADRRECVLATNVIELRLKYAKVAPLPGPQPAHTAPPAGSRPANPPQPPRRLQPLPPPGTRPERPGQLPSAARRYGNG